MNLLNSAPSWLQRSFRGWMLLAVPGLAIGWLMISGSMNAKEEPMKLLRHVVMFKFKDGTADADVAKVVDAFRGLKTKIPEIAAFEYGTDNSPEGLANGFTHLFLITFKSEQDRTVYLPHPAHKAFVDVLKPHLDKVQVIDYWAHE
ncbi:MAG: Dabb family protein [Pirellula sp.]|nr:Dabb family protein [Pirellula sp.]